MAGSSQGKYNDAWFEAVAARFKLLGEPMRLRLLRALCGQEQTVSALSLATGCSQANTSKHLAQLFQAGMVARRKEGLMVYYSVADDSIFSLCDVVCQRLEDQAAEQQAILKNESQINNNRTQQGEK